MLGEFRLNPNQIRAVQSINRVIGIVYEFFISNPLLRASDPKAQKFIKLVGNNLRKQIQSIGDVDDVNFGNLFYTPGGKEFYIKYNKVQGLVASNRPNSTQLDKINLIAQEIPKEKDGEGGGWIFIEAPFAEDLRLSTKFGIGTNSRFWGRTGFFGLPAIYLESGTEANTWIDFFDSGRYEVP